MIFKSAYGASVNNRECKDAQQGEHCAALCIDTFAYCVRNCDGDAQCQSGCGRDQAVCESQCPCGSSCPNGCPCGYATQFCNVCDTDECANFKDAVLNKMDRSVNPW